MPRHGLELVCSILLYERDGCSIQIAFHFLITKSCIGKVSCHETLAKYRDIK